MHLSDYQAKALKTYKVGEHHDQVARLARLTLGLCGRSGELAEKIKKIVDGDKELGASLQDIEKEIGEVLWYCAVLSSEIVTNLDRIAALNLAVLAFMDDRDTIKGSGDERQRL